MKDKLFRFVDKFTKVAIITVILIAIATPFIAKQYQIFQPEAAKPSTQGTMTFTNPPVHYHQVAQFYYTLLKRPRTPNFAVICYQNNKLVFVAESFNWQLSPTLQGPLSLLMANEENSYYGMSGFDYTTPADCFAYLLDEGSPNGKQTTFSTNLASFTVSP